MTAHFADAVAPLAQDDLLDRERRTALGVVHGRSDNPASTLFGWDRMLEIAATRYPAERVKITRDRQPVPVALTMTDGRIDRAKVERLMARGASMVLVSTHRHDPALGAIARDFAERSGSPMWIGSIVSTGTAGALIRHADPIDLLILQVEGAKRWRIYSPDAPDQLLFDAIIEAGDFLFLPAGHPHECDTAAPLSLHLGIAFAKDTYDMWGAE